MSELLFNEYDMSGVAEAQKRAVMERVQSIPANTLLTASEYDLIQSLIEDFRLDVPVIKDDEIYIAESGETPVDVSQDPRRGIIDRSRPFHIPGTKTVISVPFSGDPEFFKVRPHTFTMNPPRGTAVNSEILLTDIRTDHDADSIKREYLRTVASIKEYLQWLAQSAAEFNNQLEGLVTQHVKARKERILADAGMVAAIGLPIKRRHDAPTTYTVPVRRRTPDITSPRGSTAPFTPEPTLSMEEYEEILRIMSNMVRVLELSPRAFLEMGEEDLRSHFLVPLNAQYEGQATGETFNYQGKTDILIRAEGKNDFIAECKVWRGEKEYQSAIDQLLSYLSWRDTKAALLIFNRNANFTSVLEKIRAATPTHPCWKRTMGQQGETTFRYVFCQPGDRNREIVLTVLAFDIPTARQRADGSAV